MTYNLKKSRFWTRRREDRNIKTRSTKEGNSTKIYDKPTSTESVKLEIMLGEEILGPNVWVDGMNCRDDLTKCP